jgi:hypothetical protein
MADEDIFKDCPWCCEEEGLVYGHLEAFGQMRVECGCGCSGPWESSFDEARTSWNEMPRIGDQRSGMEPIT